MKRPVLLAPAVERAITVAALAAWLALGAVFFWLALGYAINSLWRLG